MSYARQLLEQIAVENGRPKEEVQGFIAALEREWLSTREQIANIDDKTFENLKIPLGIVRHIRSKVTAQQAPQVQQPPPIPIPVTIDWQSQAKQQQQQQQQQILEQPTLPQTQQQQNSAPVADSYEQKLINELRSECKSDEQFFATVQILTKLLGNIVQQPGKEEFRKLKKANKKLTDNIFQYTQAVLLLQICGFRDIGEFFFADLKDIDTQLLSQLVTQLENAVQNAQNNFNPYAPRSFGMAAQQSVYVQQQEGYDSFYTMVENLKSERQRIMSTPIKDRKIKCYVAQVSNQKNVWFEAEQADETANEKEIKAIESKSLLEAVKKAKAYLEGETFSSKRKQDYLMLLKQPVYDQTLIRIKFKYDIVLECVFSPSETPKHIVQFVKENLQDPNIPFYLYQSPPVQRVTPSNWDSTLYDLQCVPGAVFYFGSDSPQVEQMKQVLNEKLIKELGF